MRHHLKVRKGIYLIPSLLTTFGLFSGFYAIIAGMQGDFVSGAMAIFIAMLFDGLDGRAARMTNTSTSFGAEYDSMADLISFGVAPALLMFEWLLSDYGRLGWLVAFTYTIGTALRLARFNVQIATADKNYFQGLPSPTAAGLIAGFIWTFSVYDMPWIGIIGLCLTAAAGLLMVSNVRYSSFKELNLKNKIPFVMMVGIVAIIILVMITPKVMLFSIFFIYTVHGLLQTIFGLRRARRKKKTPTD